MSFKPEVEEEYKEAFSLFDKDNDGKLTRAEFVKIIENLGVDNAKKRAEEMMNEVGVGTHVVFETFRQMFLNKSKMPFKRKEIEEAFSIFDVEKTGKILDAELRQIFTQMNAQIETAELDRLIQDCEPDKTGMLDYNKLVHKMFTECFEP
jgi:calmodulin